MSVAVNGKAPCLARSGSVKGCNVAGRHKSKHVE